MSLILDCSDPENIVIRDGEAVISKLHPGITADAHDYVFCLVNLAYRRGEAEGRKDGAAEVRAAIQQAIGL